MAFNFSYNLPELRAPSMGPIDYARAPDNKEFIANVLSGLGKQYGQNQQMAEQHQLREELANEVAGLPGSPAQQLLGAGQAYSTTPTSPDTRTPTQRSLPMMAQGGAASPMSQAIASVESGGRYDAIGPRHPKYGRPLGKHQVMESNLPSWSKEVFGREVSPDEFLKTPELQEALFNAKFGQAVQKYGTIEDAASVWHSGRPLAQARAAGAKDSLGTNTTDYAAKVAAAYRRNMGMTQPSQQPTQVASADPSFVPQPGPAAAIVQRAVPLSPSLADSQGAAQIVQQSQAETQRRSAVEKAAPAATFMGLPTGQQPAGAPQMPPGTLGAPQQPQQPQMAQAPLQAPQAPQQGGQYQRALAAAIRAGDQGAVRAITELATQQPASQARPQVTEVNGRLVEYNPATGQVRDLTPPTAQPGQARPMSPEERQAYQVPPTTPAFIGPDGKPHFGPAGTSVSITNTPENKGNVAGQEAQAKRVDATIGQWSDQRKVAQSTAPQLAELGAIFERTGPQGYAATLKTQFGPALEAVGIPVAGLSDAETVQAIVEQLAPKQRVVGSGSQSDAEYKGFLRSLPTLIQNPETRGNLLSMLQAQAEVDVQKGNIADAYDMGEIDRAEAIRRARALPTPEQVYQRFKEQNREAYLAGQREAMQRRDSGDTSRLKAVEVPNEAAAERLPVGTRFRLPDGRMGIKR